MRIVSVLFATCLLFSSSRAASTAPTSAPYVPTPVVDTTPAQLVENVQLVTENIYSLDGTEVEGDNGVQELLTLESIDQVDDETVEVSSTLKNPENPEVIPSLLTTVNQVVCLIAGVPAEYVGSWCETTVLFLTRRLLAEDIQFQTTITIPRCTVAAFPGTTNTCTPDVVMSLNTECTVTCTADTTETGVVKCQPDGSFVGPIVDTCVAAAKDADTDFVTYNYAFITNGGDWQNLQGETALSKDAPCPVAPCGRENTLTYTRDVQCFTNAGAVTDYTKCAHLAEPAKTRECSPTDPCTTTAPTPAPTAAATFVWLPVEPVCDDDECGLDERQVDYTFECRDGDDNKVAAASCDKDAIVHQEKTCLATVACGEYDYYEYADDYDSFEEFEPTSACRDDIGDSFCEDVDSFDKICYIKSFRRGVISKCHGDEEFDPSAECRECVAENVEHDDFCVEDWDTVCESNTATGPCVEACYGVTVDGSSTNSQVKHSAECIGCIFTEVGDPWCTIGFDEICTEESFRDECKDICHSAQTYNNACRQCVVDVEAGNQFCLTKWDSGCYMNSQKEACLDKCHN